jgi:hypothetical protein
MLGMRQCTLAFLVAVGALTMTACSRDAGQAGGASGGAAGAVTCDRACLEGMADAYLAALARSDPAGLPLARDLRFAENNEVLTFPGGTWNTVTGLGAYRHHFADPQTGQVAVITVVEEGGTKIIYDLRLRIAEGAIREIEAMAVRDPAGARLYEEMGAPLPIFMESVPPAERVSRDDLVAVANQYLSGMVRNDPRGDYSFFADDCDRLEHARRTTNMAPEKYGHSDDTAFVTMSCREQFETGFLGFVTRIRDRRFVVDEERQTVFGMAFLDHDGTVRRIQMSTGNVFVVPPYFSVPRTLMVGEAWRVEKGRLRQIEMTLSEFPYGTRPAFETGDTWLERGAAAGDRQASAPCDRACLRRTIDGLLQAFTAHAPERVTLSPAVRFTENGQELSLGDGLWGTLTAVGRGGTYLVNPETGDAAFYGSIVEHDTPGTLALRLKAAGAVAGGGQLPVGRAVSSAGLITEIEAVIVRQETGGERGGTLTLFAPQLPDGFDGGTVRERRTLVRDDARNLSLSVMLRDVPEPPAGVSTGPFSVLTAIVHRHPGGIDGTLRSASRAVPFGMASGWE